MAATLLAVLVAAVLLAAVSRRLDISAPLALVVAGLVASAIPGLDEVELDPELVLFVILPPLLWSAGLESSYVNMRRNVRWIGSLAVGLPLATTLAVGFVAYHVVPDFTLAAALVLGAIIAPPDAVSATAVGRRLGLPRRIMTLLGGESLLNDATHRRAPILRSAGPAPGTVAPAIIVFTRTDGAALSPADIAAAGPGARVSEDGLALLGGATPGLGGHRCPRCSSPATRRQRLEYALLLRTAKALGGIRGSVCA